MDAQKCDFIKFPALRSGIGRYEPDDNRQMRIYNTLALPH